jgi:ubiquinone/menaquinone biosynthesis C-methylase UbiE
MTSAFFDSAAQYYDETFSDSEIGKLQRSRVWNYLISILPNISLNILELNCGTGEDAIWFANKGHRVLATDISEKMIRIARVKVEQFNISDKIILQQLDINEINKASFTNRFDLVFSNFGGLNCLTEHELIILSEKLKHLLNPTGRFIAVVMPDFCMIESIYFFSKFRFNQIIRRKRMQHVKINNSIVNTYYYNPKRFNGYFKNEFTLNKTVSIGLTLPPSYLNNFFAKKTNTLKVLNTTENIFGNNLFSASISDHYLIDLIVKK